MSEAPTLVQFAFIFLENIMKTTKLNIAMLGAFALVAFCNVVFAEGFPEKTGYLIDTRGNVIKTAYGLCVRTGYWTPAMAIAECDPDLVMKQMPPSAGPVSPDPAPAPIAPIPSAAPEMPIVVAAAAPEKPAVEAYFNAETLFDFDTAVVKPEGQKVLDEEIVSSMKMHTDVALLTITGHADRIGTEAYNQNLSERRANAVKDYLVKQGVAAERMRASGKGESEPNPKANTRQGCTDNMSRNRLIACLQPDRRVTVESQRRAAAR